MMQLLPDFKLLLRLNAPIFRPRDCLGCPNVDLLNAVVRRKAVLQTFLPTFP
jgi:hypothetical protein